MHCMIMTFPGHTHELFGTYQGYIGCFSWYALYDCDVSWSYSHISFDLSGYIGYRIGMHCMTLTFLGYTHILFGSCQRHIGCLVWYILYDCEVSWSNLLTI